MIDTADEVWGTSEMIIKVKEPISEEYSRIQNGHSSTPIFTWQQYLHWLKC